MVQGIDTAYLRTLTGNQPMNFAVHGAGVYDFLIFAESVPDSALCFVSASQFCLLRRKEKDYNRTGLSLYPLLVLMENGYSIDELIDIWSTNNIYLCLDLPDYKLYPYSDSLLINYTEDDFEQLFSSVPPFFEQKLAIVRCGLKRLVRKGCHVFFIEFPSSRIVADIADSSAYRMDFDLSRQCICQELAVKSIDTLRFEDTDTLVMHDLTHLNEIGARRLTEVLTHYLDTADYVTNHFISINAGSCN